MLYDSIQKLLPYGIVAATGRTAKKDSSERSQQDACVHIW